MRLSRTYLSRALRIIVRILGFGSVGISTLAIFLFLAYEPPYGLGSEWSYNVWQPNGLSYREIQVIDGLELCGLRLCYVRTAQSEFSTSRLWLSGWTLVRSEVVDPRGNSRVTQFDNGILLYKVPMRIGDHWSLEDSVSRITKAKAQHGGWVTREERDSAIGTERKVVSMETVEVPAGRFTAFVVDHFEQNGIITQRLWFDEKVGDAVKYIYGLGSVYYTRWELDNYALKPRTVSELLYLNILYFPMPLWLLGGVTLVFTPRLITDIRIRSIFSNGRTQKSYNIKAEQVDV